MIHSPQPIPRIGGSVSIKIPPQHAADTEKHRGKRDSKKIGKLPLSIPPNYPYARRRSPSEDTLSCPRLSEGSRWVAYLTALRPNFRNPAL